MNRSYQLIIVASAAFGLAVGSYEFLLPLYMESRGISYGDMGLIFSISGFVIVSCRIFVGRHSDKIGRKPYYLAALGMMGLACGILPMAGKAFSMGISKILSEMGKQFRITMQSVAVFDHAREKFLRSIGRANAPVFILQGIGVIIAGALLPVVGFKVIFIALAVILFLVAVIFGWKYIDGLQPALRAIKQESLFSHRMPKELWLIAISGFFLVAGMSASHCFVMPLFFKDKFDLSPEVVALILAVHRIALGLPMLTSGMKLGISQKTIWIIGSTIQSVTMMLTGLAPNVFLAAILWWGHDLLGGGIWEPIQQHYIQRFSRDGMRGHDLGRVTAISTSGWIVGPLLAGWAYPLSPSLPFIISGLIASLAVVPIFFLPNDS